VRRRVRVVSSSLLAAILLATTAIGPAVGHDPNDRPMLGADAHAEAEAGATIEAAVAPTGFEDRAVLSGLVHPSVIQFSPDGRIFVAEKRGTIKVFDNLSDTTPTTFVDLQTKVHDYWDRGLLGMALPPDFPTNPWVYVLYTYDAAIGATAPRWGDGCPTPPGPTTDGCVVSARLSRLPVSGDVSTGPEQVLINDWCQQYPSHSIGTVAFGPDGALYVSGGDGASFNFADYGQAGGSLAGTPTPVNPCADPANEGGALRSQDIRTMPSGGGSGADYAATVLADAPRGYWRLGEASGNPQDSSGNGNHVTVVGGTPTYGVAGAIDGNTAIDLGAADHFSIPHAAALDPAAFSIEAWVKFDTIDTTSWQVIAAKDGYTANTGWGLYWAPASSYPANWPNVGLNFVRFNAESGPVLPDESFMPVVGTWYHVVGTYDGANMRLYLNGSLVAGPIARTITGSGTSLNLGARHLNNGTSATDFLNGTIDEVAAYPTALSSARVAAHYAAATSGGPSPTDPATLDGAILRLDPATGAAMSGNPNIVSPDANARRFIANGYRNPFRFTFRPTTSELYVGDVGWNSWEEINLIASPTAGTVNHGWPCYEGSGRLSSYDNLNLGICEGLYAAPPTQAATAPYFSYNHSSTIGGATCPTANGSSIAGLAFYTGTGYPTSYRGGLFFADYSRDCIWFMPAGADGRPVANQVAKFIEGAVNPVYLTTGPGGDLFYADFDGGTIHRITFASGNLPPTAVASASPTSGQAPLTVQFTGSGSTDPESGPLTYAWDFDGNGTDDVSTANPSFTYTSPGTFLARLRVTDSGGLSDSRTVTISVNNTPPVPTIEGPTTALTWAVNDRIDFAGGASDGEDGTIPDAGLSWTLVQHHCPTNPNDCHTHDVQTISGFPTGSFSAPDHPYPSWIEIVLTATDSGGLTGRTSVRLDPKTVTMSFATVPTGLDVSVGGVTSTTPFSRTVIQGSRNTITAPLQPTLGGTTYNWQSWSDGGARSHDVLPSASGSYTATYVAAPSPADVRVTQTGQLTGSQVRITAVITNGGPGSASAVTLTDALNSKIAYVSASSTAGSCSYAAANRTVTCGVGALANGAQATVTIVANVVGKGSAPNTVTVSSSSSDPNTANNVSSISIKLR